MNKGFTLVELLIYAAVLVIIIVLITLFIFNFIETQARVKISKEMLETSQRAMEIMLWEIRHAKSIYLATSLFDSHPGQLSLATTQNAPEDETTTYLDFYLDEYGYLCLKREGETGQRIVSENVKIDNLVFSYLSATNTKSIRIELTASFQPPGQESKYHATTTLISSASLRP